MSGHEKLLLGVLTIAGFALALVTSTGAASAATTTVPVGDIYFCSAAYEGAVCSTTISAGDTVVWDFSEADISHTVTECGTSCDNPTASPLFDSGVVQSGGTYEFTFATAGTYDYYCQIHALNQRGKIVVQQASAATPAAGTATPIRIGPAGDYGGGLPTTGFGAQSHSSPQWWPNSALAVMGATLVSFSALAFVRSRKP